MLTADRAGAFAQFPHDAAQPVRITKIVKANGHRRDVHDGIHCSHFMEVDFLPGNTMSLCFRIGNNIKNFLCQAPGSLCHGSFVENLHYFRQAPMSMGMMMFMGLMVLTMLMVKTMFTLTIAAVFMAMAVVVSFFMVTMVSIKVRYVVVMIFMIPVKNDIEVAKLEARFFYPGDFNRKTISRKTGQNLLQHLTVCPQINQSRHHHIAADSRFTFKIKISVTHFLPPAGLFVQR